MVGLGFEISHAQEISAPLQIVHDLRSKLKGHATDTTREEIKQRVIEEHGSYAEHFRSLCGEIEGSLAIIQRAFGVT
jgi:hypothetical protein